MQWSSHVLPFMSKQKQTKIFKHSSYWLERVIKIFTALWLLTISSRASRISNRAANMSDMSVVMLFTWSVPPCVISVHNWRRICFCVFLLHAVHQEYSRHSLWENVTDSDLPTLVHLVTLPDGQKMMWHRAVRPWNESECLRAKGFRKLFAFAGEWRGEFIT